MPDYSPAARLPASSGVWVFANKQFVAFLGALSGHPESWTSSDETRARRRPPAFRGWRKTNASAVPFCVESRGVVDNGSGVILTSDCILTRGQLAVDAHTEILGNRDARPTAICNRSELDGETRKNHRKRNMHAVKNRLCSLNQIAVNGSGKYSFFRVASCSQSYTLWANGYLARDTLRLAYRPDCSLGP